LTAFVIFCGLFLQKDSGSVINLVLPYFLGNGSPGAVAVKSELSTELCNQETNIEHRKDDIWSRFILPDRPHHRLQVPESIATLPPFGPLVVFPKFPANESLRRTGLHLSLPEKSSFYFPAFEISCSCRTASVLLQGTMA
jgi:hypothetical protein